VVVLLFAGCEATGRGVPPDPVPTEAPSPDPAPIAAPVPVPQLAPTPAGAAPPPATAPADELREVRISTSIVDEAGEAVGSGMQYSGVRPDGRKFRGASSKFPMDIVAVEGARIRISVSEEGFVPVLREFAVPAGAESMHERIVLRRVRAWASLRIRVNAKERDLPNRVTVRLEDMAGNAIDPFHASARDVVVADGEGSAILEKVPPGEFRVEVTGDIPLRSFLLPATTTIRVEEGKNAEVAVRLEAGGRVLFHLPEGDSEDYGDQGPDILDASGEQVGGLLWGETGPGSWRNPPPRPGPATHKSGIPPGRYRIEFGPKEARLVVKEIEVRARETTEVDLRGGR
jgi:hypothetical protein